MPTVLAVQSHVVHGYVGNRAATFPLQFRGWDVDALNTVQFSNHTGYGAVTGRKTTAEEIRDLYKGLRTRNFRFDALLTGYIPSAEAVRAVGESGIDIVERFPDAVWLLDPVMGDNGRLYVAPEVVPVYKEVLRSGRVTITAPNGFEAETLTGVNITDEASAIEALQILHNEWKIPNVVITSVKCGDRLLAVGVSPSEEPFAFDISTIDGYFTGTGDLFSALLLDNYWRTTTLKYDRPLGRAVGATLKTTHKILLGTHAAAKDANGGRSTRGDPESMSNVELRIIPLRSELEPKDTDYEIPHIICL